MSVLFKGIVNVSGTHDSGKSRFAFECGAPPEKMAFIDTDLKGRDFVEQVLQVGRKLALYKDMVTLTRGKKELDTHKLYMDAITEMEAIVKKDGKFEALVWDTWTPFEITFH